MSAAHSAHATNASAKKALDGTVIVSTGQSLVFDNGFVSVDLHSVTFPNGAQGTHAVVHTSTDLGAVIVPVVIKRGMVYFGLARQHRFVLGDFTLEFPRGGTRNLCEAEALREVEEEMGALPRRMDQVGVITPDSGMMPVKVGVWIALMETTVMDSQHVEAETGLVMDWVSEGTFAGLAKHGKVSCSLTLAAYSLWVLNRGQYGSLLRP